MSEAEIKSYRITLEHEMRSHHDARMTAMFARQYAAMDDYNQAFYRILAQIETIDKILQNN